MTVKRLMSFSDFGKLVGLSRSAICRASKQEHLLKPATFNTQIDLDHPASKKYLNKKKLKINFEEEGYPETKSENSLELQLQTFSEEQPNPNSVTDFLDMTMREIFSKFGTIDGFLNYLKATQIIAMVNEKNLKNSVLEGKLISRDIVKKGFFDPVNTAHLRLMTDGAKNISATVRAKVMSNESSAVIEKIVAEMIGTFIKPAKLKMIKALKDASKNSDIDVFV